MNRRHRRKRITKGELMAMSLYYGFMAFIVIIVCIGMYAVISEKLNEQKDETVSVYGFSEDPIDEQFTDIQLPSISPTNTPLPTPTITSTPTPTSTPSPTITPTPEPVNYWGCDHKCDDDGRYYDIDLDSRYQVYIHEMCEKIGVPFELAIATCWKESRYNPNSYNSNNRNGTVDAGLFQINSCNWEWFKEIFGELWDPYEPYDSIDAGLYYIQYCMEYSMQFSDDPKVFMMVYNMGPTGARKLWKQGIWSSQYSRDIYYYMTEELPTLKIIED